ncbi:MAG: TRL-like family protein [Nitrospirota bacterium]|nr:TRL-like family protein [Nitrospirota bacterium]
MRTPLTLCVLLAGFLVTGCQPVASPLAGVIYNQTKYGDVATTNSNAAKEGKACAYTVMGLFAGGDASVDAAKKAGGITEVASVDHSTLNILGITADWCTIVHGK